MAEKESKFTLSSAEELLHKNKIVVKNKVIELKHGVGLGILSACDYLVNFHKYMLKVIPKKEA